MAEETGRRRARQYPLWLSEEERAAFDEAAKAAGLSLADWMRTRCLAAAKREARERQKDEQ